MDLQFLPHVNAALNATSAVFLVSGFYFIHKRNVAAHRACMLGALGASAVFLSCYLLYHFAHGSTKFKGDGWLRTLYLTILTSHTVLAVVILPFVFLTFRRAFRGENERHRKIAKITFPMWLYVSVTGVIVYLMLYQM